MGDGRGAYRVFVRGRDNLKNLGIDGRVILKWISIKWEVGAWTGFIWLRMGTGGGCL
jgi:hypothetical protein